MMDIYKQIVKLVNSKLREYELDPQVLEKVTKQLIVSRLLAEVLAEIPAKHREEFTESFMDGVRENIAKIEGFE